MNCNVASQRVIAALNAAIDHFEYKIMKAVDFPLEHVLIRKWPRGQAVVSYRVEQSRVAKNTVEIYSYQTLIGIVRLDRKEATLNMDKYTRSTTMQQVATRAWLNRHNYNVAIVKAGELYQ
jgi:hypothetical protein